MDADKQSLDAADERVARALSYAREVIGDDDLFGLEETPALVVDPDEVQVQLWMIVRNDLIGYDEKGEKLRVEDEALPLPPRGELDEILALQRDATRRLWELAHHDRGLQPAFAQQLAAWVACEQRQLLFDMSRTIEVNMAPDWPTRSGAAYVRTTNQTDDGLLSAIRSAAYAASAYGIVPTRFFIDQWRDCDGLDELERLVDRGEVRLVALDFDHIPAERVQAWLARVDNGLEVYDGDRGRLVAKRAHR